MSSAKAIKLSNANYKKLLASQIPERTWNTIVAAAAIIDDKMPHEVIETSETLYKAIKSLAQCKVYHELDDGTKMPHLWQYRVAMRDHLKQLKSTALAHLDESHWINQVLNEYKIQNYTNIQFALYTIIARYENVHNLEALIDNVYIENEIA